MAKRRKLAPAKKVIIILGSLTLIEVGYLYIFRNANSPVAAREAIESAVRDKKSLGASRREQLRVQTAIRDYQIKNKKLPVNLRDLVPVYFDKVPLDPDTDQPFMYRVEGDRFFLGKEDDVKMANAKDGATPGGKEATLDAGTQIALLEQSEAARASFIYNPSGKRDPFMPFDLSPKQPDDSGKTPLEKYAIGQLKLTAVLEGFEDTTAIVENNVGKGFPVKKGTKIGPNEGEVIEILPDKLIILETEIDFTGQKKTRTTEMRLRTKDQDGK